MDNIKLLGKVLANSTPKVKFVNTFPINKLGEISIKTQITKGDIIEIEDTKKKVNLIKSTISILNGLNSDSPVSNTKYKPEDIYGFITTDINKNLHTYLYNSSVINNITYEFFPPKNKFSKILHNFLIRLAIKKKQTIEDLELCIYRAGKDKKTLIISPKIYSILKASEQFTYNKQTLNNFTDIFHAGLFMDLQTYVNPLANNNDLFIIDSDISLYYDDYVQTHETESGMDIDLNYVYDVDEVFSIKII